MPGIHTHYDNLKISRDAHPKVIREAYKKLSRQYHPDHNPNDPNATKVMQVINLAYDVLSDSARRREHDLWIERMEAEQQNPQPHYSAPPFEQVWRSTFQAAREESPFAWAFKSDPESDKSRQDKTSGPNLHTKAIGEHILKHWFWYVLTIATITGFGYQYYSSHAYNPFVTTSQQHGLQLRQANGKQQVDPRNNSATASKPDQTAAKNVGNVRAETAPDGKPWPYTASYMEGFEQSNSTGLSSVMADNTKGGTDLLVKLYSLDGNKPRAVRVFYIPAHASFMVEKLTQGLYDIRFLDLKTGQLFRTEPFELHEMHLANGARYTGVSMILNAPPGNMETVHKLAAEDF